MINFFRGIFSFFVTKRDYKLDIYYVTKRGKNKGVIQKPHIHKNGKYVVSKTRFEEDYIFVDNYSEIKIHLEQGFKVRVSSSSPKTAPSLVSMDSLKIVQ
ncbi:hypothetical protein [Vibrio sp. Vb2297]|nr:hypothetical protein [Vibrio sp. Vb2297]MDW1798134.1 hypothetical protein [Vibrio sp. Vb2297]